jgi:hypothetical protein
MHLLARVKGILLNPRQEWAVIDAEPFNQSAILTGYVLPLAAIGPIASFIGWTVFGLGFGIRLGPAAALTGAITSYILAIVGVFVLAWIANALAPTFGGQQNFGQAFKLAAYCSTAVWVGGILGIIPALGLIGSLIGLYSIYLLYLGIPVLMKSPPDKTITYMVALVVVMIVIFWLAAALTMRMRY